MKIALIFGTRPEGIKMIPLYKELIKNKKNDVFIINTAQHREMLDQVLDLFKVETKYDLDSMNKTTNLTELISHMTTELNSIFQIDRPDLVLVHGDTLSTLIGAQTAFYNQIEIGHVEAGLRTNNLKSPFPEEANRQVVARYANYHFASTVANKEALQKENIHNNIFVVGNTVIDALFEITSLPFHYEHDLETIMNNNKKTILVTTHRRENFEQLKNIYAAINRITSEFEDVQIIFPAHKNPLIRKEIKSNLHDSENIHVIEPQDYKVFANLLKDCHFIVTDSGGIQEEAPALGKPVIVVRDTTERQEGVDAGTLILAGTSTKNIYDEIHSLLTNSNKYSAMQNSINPYGTGDTSSLISKIINEL